MVGHWKRLLLLNGGGTGTMGDNKKIFDDFPTVDCNECERYWLNQCDGVKPSSEAQKVPCNSFLATRKVVIPQQIKRLQKSVFWLELSVVSLAVCIFILSCILSGR